MQLFQWVYGMQCMEMHCLLDEEGGEETGQEDLTCVYIAAGKDEKNKQNDQI